MAPTSSAPPVRVLLASTARYPFVQDDIDLLGGHFDLDVYIGSGVRGAWENFRRAMRADVSYSWFGSVYTFFMVLGARLARRRAMVMLGGVDVAREPALAYGIWRSRWKGMLLGWALQRADRVFAVDISLRATLERSSGRRWEKIEALPTGYDVGFWTPRYEKADCLLCVATCDSIERAGIKGLDLLIEAARGFQGIEFIAIGIAPLVIEHYAPSLPPNMRLIPPVPRRELLEHYQRARVYCQPSRREGLPNALCEAMLCGCIPVGTRVGGIPTAIADCGFIAEPNNAGALRDAIERALSAPESLARKAHEHIARSFPRERRERALVHTILELAGAEAID
jgi:glycosyltransferase involved in cell wall biosynthesis